MLYNLRDISVCLLTINNRLRAVKKIIEADLIDSGIEYENCVHEYNHLIDDVLNMNSSVSNLRHLWCHPETFGRKVVKNDI